MTVSSESSEEYIKLIDELYEDDYITISTSEAVDNETERYVSDISSELDIGLTIIKHDEPKVTPDVEMEEKDVKEVESQVHQSSKGNIADILGLMINQGKDMSRLNDIFDLIDNKIQSVRDMKSLGNAIKEFDAMIAENPSLRHYMREKILNMENRSRQHLLISATSIFGDTTEVEPDLYVDGSAIYSVVDSVYTHTLLDISFDQGLVPADIESGSYTLSEAVDTVYTFVNLSVDFYSAIENLPRDSILVDYDLTEAVNTVYGCTILDIDIYASVAGETENRHIEIVV